MEVLNLRTLINLVSCEITKKEHDSKDNMYTARLEMTHGPSDMPYNSTLYFRDDEIVKLIDNLGLLIETLRDFCGESKR